MNPSPQFRLDSDSEALAAFLSKLVMGACASYETLSAVIGSSVQTSSRHCLHRAREIVRRDFKMVFGTVIGVGLRRLADAEIVDISDKARDRTRRHARRTLRKLACAEYQALDKEKQVKHNAALSLFGFVARATTARAFARVESKVADTGAKLPLSEAAMRALGTIS